MKENFFKTLAFVKIDEGAYSNHPNDPGGPTRLGITIHDYRRWTGRHVDANDVRRMPESVVGEIYKKWYWDTCKCDLLPSGVDYFVFDSGILSGTGTAAKWLQRAVGTSPDGKIGPKTIEAANRLPAKTTILKMETLRRNRLRSLSNWRYFGKGWTNRVNKSKARAVKLIGA